MLISWVVKWEFVSSGGSDMDRWVREQRGCQLGLCGSLPSQPFVWRQNRDICILPDLCGRISLLLWPVSQYLPLLFLVQSSFPGARDGDVNIFLGGEIKLSPEFYWWVSVICFSEIKSLPTHYKTGNFNSLRVTGVYRLWVSNGDVLQICLGLLCATAL